MQPDLTQKSLTEKQKKHLRGLAHAREPVVLVGQGGLSPAITGELETALGAHELVKVRDLRRAGQTNEERAHPAHR
jgi:RNA-binding protein